MHSLTRGFPVCVLVFTSVSMLAGTLHVSPTGRDDHPGTAAEPLRSLTIAINKSRQLPPSEPRRILIHAGTYENTRVRLEPEDSGLEITAAPGERPRLLGGQRLMDWNREEGSLWTASLPPWPHDEVGETPRESRWEVRALLVNGTLAPRARLPETGTLEHETAFDVPWMSSTGGGWQRRPTEEELTTLRYRTGDLGAWLDIRNAEITVYHMWDESCVGIAAHDQTTRVLQLTPPTGHPPGAFGVKKYVLWNLREGLTRPGQWFHNRAANRIVYWPPAGTDPNNSEIVVPTTTTVLRIEGTRDQPVRNITVRGLDFASTTVPLRAGGFGAGAYPGAIELSQAQNCRFEDLKIRGVGGHAIRAGGGIEDIQIRKCEVAQCGAGGIYVGGLRAIIEDNHVHGIGLQYPSAIGIFRGGTDCVVRHNEVHDCSYSAINYGGTRNRLENNLLYDCMKVLHDGAGIYMFAATNCVLRGNLARDIVDTGGYGASAFYLDERSVGCVVENNVSLRVNWPTHHHMATNNVLRNNIFLVNGDARLTFPRSTQYSLERNVILATGKIRIENIDGIAHWDRNVLFSGTGRIERVKQDRYSAREVVVGAPADTNTDDPKFDDWTRLRYDWAPDSPLGRLGIQPVDVRSAGVR